MPAFFRWLSLLDPVRHFLVIVRGVFLKRQGILLAMAAVALGFSVARFRKAVT